MKRFDTGRGDFNADGYRAFGLDRADYKLFDSNRHIYDSRGIMLIGIVGLIHLIGRVFVQERQLEW